MTRLLPVLVLLVGCGGPPLCEADGLLLVDAEVPVSCAAFAQHTAIARNIFGQRILDARTYLPTFQGVTVRVRDVDSWDSHGADVIGQYFADRKHIDVARSGRPLFHEMLHHLEHVRGVADAVTAQHLGWSSNGFDYACSIFASSATPYVAPSTP